MDSEDKTLVNWAGKMRHLLTEQRRWDTCYLSREDGTLVDWIEKTGHLLTGQRSRDTC